MWERSRSAWLRAWQRPLLLPGPKHARRRRSGWQAVAAVAAVAALAAACAAPRAERAPESPGAAPAGTVSGTSPTASPVPPVRLRLAHDPALAGWARDLAAEWRTAGTVVEPVGADPSAPLLLTASAATVGQAPASAVVGWRYTVLAQPWLDPPVALTAAEARRAAGDRDTAAVTALTRLDRLDWGLAPVPVDGITPDPAAIVSGRYPLVAPIYLAVRPGAGTAAGDALQVVAEPGSATRRSGLGDGGPAVTLAAVGDIMLARGVENMMRGYGWEYPVAHVAERLAAADIAFANLESPLGTGGTPLEKKGIWFRAPPEAVRPLVRAGIDAVGLGNNHTLDYGPELLLETLAILDEAGIGYTGGGRDLAEARRPLILERGGMAFALLAYNAFAPLTWSATQPQPLLATPGRPGTVPPDPALMAADIAAARAKADVVVVAVHWGEEYQNQPAPAQVALGRQMAALGADIVLGSHPHAIQGFERHQRGFIAWSLGNFIMDQDSLGEIPREAMLLEFTFHPGGGRSVRLLPAYSVGFRPTWPDAERGEALRTKLRRLSGWGYTPPRPGP